MLPITTKENDGSGRARQLRHVVQRSAVGVVLVFVLLYAFFFFNQSSSRFRRRAEEEEAEEGTMHSPASPFVPSTEKTPTIPLSLSDPPSNFCDEFSLQYASSSGGSSFSPSAGLFYTSSSSVSSLSPASENVSKQQHTSSVLPSSYVYYTVCVTSHSHHHRVNLSLVLLSSPSSSAGGGGGDAAAPVGVIVGDADLYISTLTSTPTRESGSQWISRDDGNDSISLPTYSPDFRTGGTGTANKNTASAAAGRKDSAAAVVSLFVGVRGRSVDERVGGVGVGVASASLDVLPTYYTLTVDIVDVPDSEILARGKLRGGKRIMEGQAPSRDDLRKDEEEQRLLEMKKTKENLLDKTRTNEDRNEAESVNAI